MKSLALGMFVGIFALSITQAASAHVVVKPNKAQTGAFETFTVSVPNEKDIPNTAIKLEIPDSLEFVTPSVKDGWTVETEKTGEGESAKTKSITWSGGSLPAHFRDDFTFSAKLPAKATDLRWNAYQTFEDGTVTSWNLAEDKQPKKEDGSPDFSKSGPFSVTKVSSETEHESHEATSTNAGNKAETATVLAAMTAGISLVALFFATRRPAAK
jgi:uncharacterized protein YcnI